MQTLCQGTYTDNDLDVQPCNPAVGGPAKSQLVHEVDALGGEMGKMADRCYVQKRVLNRSKVTPPPRIRYELSFYWCRVV